MEIAAAVAVGLILLVLEEVFRRSVWPRLFRDAEGQSRIAAGEPEEEDASVDGQAVIEGELEEEEWAILELLAAAGTYIGNDTIESELEVHSTTRVRVHLDQLIQMGLVREVPARAGSERWYELTHEGREFAVAHGLDL